MSPSVVVFDVNETLSDLSPLGSRFEDVGAPAGLMPTWFASVLRDGFALTVVGENPGFADLAGAALRTLLPRAGVTGDVDGAVRHVLEGFGSLDVHPDVPDGVRALSDAGFRLVTLSNGATSVAEGLLERAGLRDHVERLLSVEQAGRWKPAPEAYAYAADQCGVEQREMLLVASHPWDVDGAQRAGLAGAWVDRAGAPYPPAFREPDLRVDSLVGLAERLRSS